MNIITNEVKILGELFKVNGFQIRVVGGAVRDHLMGIEPKDIDICVNTNPYNVMKICQDSGFKVIPTGISHGTVTVVVNNTAIEITSLRVDKVCDGRHAEISFTNSWKADAGRRDLTINAMSMNLSGKIFDYFGGADDLANKRVRFIGDAEKRIREDYLRIFRFFRFSGKINVSEWDVSAIDAIKNNLPGLKWVSVERHWSELSKILMCDDFHTVLTKMKEVGIFKVLNFRMTEKSASRVNNLPKDVALRMVSIFQNSESICNFLRVDNATKEKVNFLVKMEKTQTNLTDSLVMMTLAPDIQEARSNLFALAHLQKHNRLADTIAAVDIPKCPVTSRHLIEMGISPGPAMGKILKDTKIVWAESMFTMSVDEILQEVVVRSISDA